MGKCVDVGKVTSWKTRGTPTVTDLYTDSFIWTIPEDEVMKMRKSDDETTFMCEAPLCSVPGSGVYLGLSRLEGGEGGKVWLCSTGEVSVNLECTLIIQQEWRVDVRVSGSSYYFMDVPQLFENSRRGLVVEVRMGSCEVDTRGGAPSARVSMTKGEVAPTKGEVTPTKGEVAPTKVEVTPTKVEVTPTKGEVASTKVAVAPTKVVGAAEEPWSLEKALEYLGEDTPKEKVKNIKKVSKKEKKKQKLRGSKSDQEDNESIIEKNSNKEEETAKEEEQQKEKVENVKRLKMKLEMDGEELREIKMETSMIREEVKELEEGQRRNRRREEQLRGLLAEELRSREVMVRGLMEQISEEKERGRVLMEQVMQGARVAESSPRLLEAGVRKF